MADSYTNELRLAIQVAGENDTTWGDITNTNLKLIEDAISGLKEIATTGGDTTLSTNNASTAYAGSEDQARYASLKITGALSSNANIIVPAKSKIYVVWNATSGAYTVTVKVSGSTGVVVSQNKRTVLLCDGGEIYSAFTDTGSAGDVFGPASSVASEIALFDGATGKLLKSATTTGLLKAASGVLSAAVVGIDYLSPNLTINDQTGTTYTLQLTDVASYVRLSNAAAITLTVPPNSSVAFPTGTQISLRQVNTGQVTVAQGSGVTVNTAETLKLRTQHSTATLIKVAENTWDLTGDLEESA